MSAAAPVIPIETPAYFQGPNLQAPGGEASSLPPIAREAIGDLVHELRQPLSSIEAIAYFLEMTLPPEQWQARQYMRRLQELVDQAESILGRTVSSARKPPASAPSA